MVRLKKTFLCVAVVLFVASITLFAEWSVGDYVDDFDDPTGEHFAMTICDGYFSNSATSKSDLNVRVVGKISSSYRSWYSIRWEFQIHEYGWDNPTDEFFSDSTATIKIKDDAGKTYSFSRSNSKYSRSWNFLYGDDAIRFYNLVVSNKVLKVAIAIDSTKYVFTIDCGNAKEILENVYSLVPQKDENPLNEFITISEKSDFMDGYWNFDVKKYSENSYIDLSLFLSKWEYANHPYLAPSIYKYEYKENPLNAKFCTSSIVDFGNYKKIVFITSAGKQFAYINTSSDSSMVDENWLPAYEAIKNDANAKVQLFLSDGSSYEFPLNGPKFAEGVEYVR